MQPTDRRYLPTARSGNRQPQTHLTLRLLVVINEYGPKCLAIRVGRRVGSYEVIETLAEVMLLREIRQDVRSDDGPEFVAMELRKQLAGVGSPEIVHRARQSLGERLL